MLDRVEELVARRQTSDRKMGYIWMVVPILPMLLGIAIAASIASIIISSLSQIGTINGPTSAIPVVAQILGLYAFAIISVYAILVLGAIAIYYLIDRRNNHFRRQQQLYKTLGAYMSTREAANPGQDASKLSQLTEDSMFEERDRPAGLWAILYLFVTPITSLIVAYDLTVDMRRHEERQLAYHTALTKALAEIGAQPQSIPSPNFHKRDALLYLILTAITAGLFWIYWFYILLKDYNQHFRAQAMEEDAILTILKPRRPSTICQTCGGPVVEGSNFCPFCGRPQSM